MAARPSLSPWPQWPYGWVVPPSPYPAVRPTGPVRPQQGSGSILGARPQAYNVELQQPTDIEAAMHTLGLTPPDPNWYMDTGATSYIFDREIERIKIKQVSNPKGKSFVGIDKTFSIK